MRTTAIAAAVALTLGTPAAFAGGPTFEDYARVRDVTPEYENVNVPRQECYSEVVPQTSYRGGNSIIGPLIGGVAGGLIGSRVGEGNGRVAAAAAGAAVGALVGNHLSNRDRYEEVSEREVRRCRTVDNWESRVTGYRVAQGSSDQVSPRALRQVRMNARRRDEAKVGTLARSATMQAPHLTQPDKFSSLSRDRGDLGRWLRGLLLV